MKLSGIKRSFGVSAIAGLVAVALLYPASAPATAASKGPNESGGRAVAHAGGGKIIKSAALAKAAPRTILSRIGVDSIEPTIGIAQNGDVFTSAYQTTTRIEVVRSQDKGKSWEIVSPTLPNGRNAQLLSLDPYTYADIPLNDTDNTRIFTIDLNVACSYLSFSDDNGESWTTNPLVCGRPVNDHQTLFGGPPATSTPIGYPNVLYYCWNDVATSSCQKSINGGLTFTVTGSPAYPGADEAGFCGGLHGHGVVDDRGWIYLPKDHCGRPFVSISKDEGATWERIQVAKDDLEGGPDPSVAVDKKGNIYYVYADTERIPYLVVSKNGGKTWSKPVNVAAPGVNETNLATLTVGAPGKVAISYMGTTNAPGGPVEEREAGEYKDTTWHGYITQTVDALESKQVFYSSTVNNKKDPLLRGQCEQANRCDPVYDFIDVEIDRSGDIWTPWVDGCIAICITTGPGSLGKDGVVGRTTGINMSK